MVDENFLLQIALLGIELAGFIGLVAALHPAPRGWLPQEIAGVKLILEFAIGAVFFSLLPLLLFYSLGSAELTWRLSSAALAVFLGLEIWIQQRRIRTLFRIGYSPRAPWFVALGLFPGSMASLILEGVNLLWWGSIAGYVWALTWLLAAPAIEVFIFIYFTMHPPPLSQSRERKD